MFSGIFLTVLAASAGSAPEVEQSIITRPTRLLWPAFDLRYERVMNGNWSLFGETTLGPYNPLIQRLKVAFAELGGAEFKIQSYGGTVGANSYFKGFERGWYVGSSLGYDFAKYQLAYSGGSQEGNYQILSLAPHGGYKVVTDLGFTFVWELGGGYGFVLANNTDTDSQRVAPAASGAIWTGGLFLGWSF